MAAAATCKQAGRPLNWWRRRPQLAGPQIDTGCRECWCNNCCRLANRAQQLFCAAAAAADVVALGQQWLGRQLQTTQRRTKLCFAASALALAEPAQFAS